MNCEFCERFEYLHEDDFKPPNGVKVVFKVSLVEEHYRKRRKSASISYAPHDFSYCPVCGDKIQHIGE